MQKLVKFLKGAIYELQKVQWPNKKETIRLTAHVLGVSLGVGAFALTLDYIFKTGLTLLAGR